MRAIALAPILVTTGCTGGIPRARSNYAMTFDRARQQVILFGGTFLGADFSQMTRCDTWTWRP